MTPRILVLYYSQSGQLRDILDNLLLDIRDKAEIDIVQFRPEKAFPFPWTAYTFFDAMPETVERIALPIKPLPQNIVEKNYDLVILGYQPWFLNPSQPTTGFLKSDWAAKLLKEKPVLTVVGCRNMWLHGQEKVKEDLNAVGAKLAGNIVLLDTHPNLISLLTVIRWAFKGQKEASGVLPAAGVQDADIKGAKRFGPVIIDHITKHNLDTLQSALLEKGAITLNPGLVLLEQRGIKNFRYWAKFIREKGGPGDPNRKGRVKLFQRLLLTAIFILSPLSSLTAAIKLQLKKRSLLKDVEYFKGVRYEKGRI
jgi:hypothetical protein